MKIIIEPLVTEKSVSLAQNNKYVFKVVSTTNKNEVKKEINRIYKVDVTAVNILYRQEKIKQRNKIVGKQAAFKKAIVTLKKGQKIKELEIKE